MSCNMHDIWTGVLPFFLQFPTSVRKVTEEVKGQEWHAQCGVVTGTVKGHVIRSNQEVIGLKTVKGLKI